MCLLPRPVHGASPLACSRRLTDPRHRPVSLHRSPSKAVRACHVHCCMATQAASALPSRRSANYPPTAWDDGFIQSLPSDLRDSDTSQVAVLKEEVRHLIGNKGKELVEQLELVDTVRQLGVSYHFEKEIRDMLATISRSIDNTSIKLEDDLHAIALFFRLMREHGFDVPQDILKSFKDEKGSFKASIFHDTKGLLSLYEASFLNMDGEEQLEEARVLTTQHLTSFLKSSVESTPLREQVAYALDLPLHWRMPRGHSRWFINLYERKEDMNPKLLELATLDFNIVQSIHKRELKEVSRWWNNMGLLRGQLSFARDRLVENYLWAVGWAFEPKFWRCREAQTKANCLITTIDDIYDIYGSLDELELFTKAVERWEAGSIDKLPEYMKVFFLAVFNTTNDTAYKIMKDKGVNIIPYLKRAWEDLCKSYLVEARWYHNGYQPTLEEYLENAWISISGHVILTCAFCTSETITKEVLQSFKCYPDVVRHAAMILRLCDDLATSSAELARGDVSKSIQCYMHDKGVSEATARKHIAKLISDSWIKLNEERIANSTLEESFKSVAINLGRMAQCIYHNGDGYGDPHNETKDQINSLFIKPIPLKNNLSF